GCRAENDFRTPQRLNRDRRDDRTCGLPGAEGIERSAYYDWRSECGVVAQCKLIRGYFCRCVRRLRVEPMALRNGNAQGRAVNLARRYVNQPSTVVPAARFQNVQRPRCVGIQKLSWVPVRVR